MSKAIPGRSICYACSSKHNGHHLPKEGFGLFGAASIIQNQSRRQGGGMGASVTPSALAGHRIIDFDVSCPVEFELDRRKSRKPRGAPTRPGCRIHYLLDYRYVPPARQLVRKEPENIFNIFPWTPGPGYSRLRSLHHQLHISNIVLCFAYTSPLLGVSFYYYPQQAFSRNLEDLTFEAEAAISHGP